MAFFTSIDKSTITILIIEDEQMLRDYVADYLEDTGYVVHKACNGREGLEQFRKVNPDLVITDLRMPEINGLELMALLKAEAPEIPIIVVSGTGSLEDVIQTIKLGAWDYILKPVKDIIVVDVAIDRAMERKMLIEENRRYREQLESEVVRRTREMLKSNEKFKTLFNNAGDAIFIHDMSGTLIEVNNQAYANLGVDPGTLVNRTIADIYTREEGLLLPHYLELIARKKSILYETSLRHRDGRTIPVEVSACVVEIEGTATIFAICRDISERKQAEIERSRLEKQFVAAQKMESLGLLAGGIAHDFRNILGSISGFSQLLEKKLVPQSKEAQYVEKMQKAIAKGLELTDKLTTFTRKGSGEHVRLDLHKVLSDTVELLRPACKQIDINLECNAATTHILGDATLLVNAFINLGINARDAMPAGGTIRITTDVVEINNREAAQTSQACHFIRVTFADTGSGMSAEVLSHLFEPLFTTKGPGKGTGLGLTSVYNTVTQHHGIIEVDSVVPQGTTFRIFLPLAAQTNADGSEKASGAGPGAILVIDDEKMVHAMARQLLGELGYQVVCQEKALEALEYFKANSAQIGLVLIDQSMPVMNGREIAAELCTISAGCRIVLTSATDVTVCEASLPPGISGCIGKPFTHENLAILTAKTFGQPG